MSPPGNRLCETAPMSTSSRNAALVLLAASSVLAGCDEPPVGPAATSSASAATAKPKPSASAGPVKKQAAIEVERLKKALRCTATSQGGPCLVLNDFKDCQPHKLITPGGEGRWIGRGYRVKNTKYVEEYTLVRSRRVPTSEVGAGQVGAKVALTQIPESESGALQRAPRAINKLAHDDAPKANNPAMLYLKNLKDWSESYATEADDNQVYVSFDDGIYLCQQHAHQRLLLIGPSKSGKHPADGLYAEVYPASW